ncbi:MAG: MFS transporter [Catenulispora sp.]
MLIPGLLLFGQLSDRLGRRPAIALGMGLDVVALLLFALADGAVWLFAARGLLGLAQGMLSGAATAALTELTAGRKRYAALMATLAQAGRHHAVHRRGDLRRGDRYRQPGTGRLASARWRRRRAGPAAAADRG